MNEIALVGYNRQTELVAQEYKIPVGAIEQAKKIADVPADDPDVAHAYELQPSAAKKIADMIAVEIDDTAALDFFLEGFKTL